MIISRTLCHNLKNKNRSKTMGIVLRSSDYGPRITVPNLVLFFLFFHLSRRISRSQRDKVKNISTNSMATMFKLPLPTQSVSSLSYLTVLCCFTQAKSFYFYSFFFRKAKRSIYARCEAITPLLRLMKIPINLF